MTDPSRRILDVSPDSRRQPFTALRWVMPMPEHDREEREERHLLRRMDIQEAVRK